MNNEPLLEKKEILSEIFNLAKSTSLQDKNFSTEIYIKDYLFYAECGVFEEHMDKSVKLTLIHNLPFDRGDYLEVEPSRLRIFMLDTQNGRRYFTSIGSVDYLGENHEHTKDDFLKLLHEHRHLNNDELIINMKAIVLYSELYSELNENISTHGIQLKKPKI